MRKNNLVFKIVVYVMIASMVVTTLLLSVSSLF